MLPDGAVESYLEKGRDMHRGTTAEFRVKNLFSEPELLLTHAHFLGPVAAEFRQPVFRGVQI